MPCSGGRVGVIYPSPIGRAGYSIIWSARWRSDWGIVRPMALAVLRLMTSSNFVGRSNGKSPGFAPLKILSTRMAPRRYCFACDEVHNLLSLPEGQTVQDEEKPAWTLAGQHSKNALEVCGASHFVG